MINYCRLNVRCAMAGLALLTGCRTGAFAPKTDLHLQTGRYGHGAVTDGKRIYVVGGSGPAGFLGDIEAIDPTTGESQVITTDLMPRRYHSAVIKGDDIYIVGGITSMGAEPVVEIFDLKSRTIRAAAPLPTPRRMAKSVLIGDDIYVIGGQDQEQPPEHAGERTGVVEVFDTVNNTWRTAPSMRSPRECAVVASRGKIYAIAGYNGGARGLPAFETYDTETGQWTTNADLPFYMSAHSALVIEDDIFTFGDYEQLDRVARYSLREQQWTELDVGYMRSRHNACVALGGEVFVIGGNVASGGSHLDLVQRFSVRELGQPPK